MKRIVLFYFIFCSIGINAQVEIPQLDKYVTDFTASLNTRQIDILDSDLREFEDSTSNQIVFLMITSLDSYPIETFSYEVADKNKIGQKNKNNGVLFLVVKNDRKMRIEVGYGLEGALPDALSSSIIRNVIAPNFKRDDYYSGIKAGLEAIKLATIGEFKNENRDSDNEDEGLPIFPIIIFIIIYLISKFGKGGGRGGRTIFYGGGFGGSSGGSFGGGSFGGFSGGGGSFGGGGSSGSW